MRGIFFSFTSELTYKVGQKARTVLYFFCTLALLLVYHWMNEWMMCVLDLHFSDPIFLFIIFILKMSQSTSKGQEKDTWWKETSWLDILLFFFTSHDHHFSICLAEKTPPKHVKFNDQRFELGILPKGCSKLTYALQEVECLHQRRRLHGHVDASSSSSWPPYHASLQVTTPLTKFQKTFYFPDKTIRFLLKQNIE